MLCKRIMDRSLLYESSTTLESSGSLATLPVTNCELSIILFNTRRCNCGVVMLFFLASFTMGIGRLYYQFL